MTAASLASLRPSRPHGTGNTVAPAGIKSVTPSEQVAGSAPASKGNASDGPPPGIVPQQYSAAMVPAGGTSYAVQSNAARGDPQSDAVVLEREGPPAAGRRSMGGREAREGRPEAWGPRGPQVEEGGPEARVSRGSPPGAQGRRRERLRTLRNINRKAVVPHAVAVAALVHTLASRGDVQQAYHLYQQLRLEPSAGTEFTLSSRRMYQALIEATCRQKKTVLALQACPCPASRCVERTGRTWCHVRDVLSVVYWTHLVYFVEHSGRFW